MGEVGLETLYWQAFVDAFKTRFQIDPARLIPLTRSGAHIWYGSPKAVEIYGMRDVRDVRVENRLRIAKTGMIKQMAVTPFDRALYRDARETLGLTDALTLHPAWMYQTLQPFWNGDRGLTWVEQALRFAPVPIPQIPMDLPPRYVAVSFYARGTWPPTSQTADCARETIALIAKQIPVVILHQGLHMDDHVEYVPKSLPENVILLSDKTSITPQNSLAVISAVMAKASAFVGTYGGLSHLALRYGIPSVNLFTEWRGILLAHRQLSEALALQTNVAYHILKLHEIPILQDVLPRIVYQAPTSSAKGLALPPETV